MRIQILVNHLNRDLNYISKAIDVIHKYWYTYTIAELASTVCYSEAYFMREFKKSIGMTVTEFIIRAYQTS